MKDTDAALMATFALASETFFMLLQKGALTHAEGTEIIDRALHGLERNRDQPGVDSQSVEAAHGLLEQLLLGIGMYPPAS